MLRHLSALALLAAIALPVSGCCNPSKSPGRCAACVYDNCVVPNFSSSAAPAPMTESQLPAQPAAIPMAF